MNLFRGPLWRSDRFVIPVLSIVGLITIGIAAWTLVSEIWRLEMSTSAPGSGGTYYVSSARIANTLFEVLVIAGVGLVELAVAAMLRANMATAENTRRMLDLMSEAGVNLSRPPPP